MKTHSNSNIITLGRGHGIEILNAVKKAQTSVKIVSPYLSSSYLDELVDLHKKGVKITLITSDNLTEQGTSYAFDDTKIIKKEKIKDPSYDLERGKLTNSLKFSFFAFLISIPFSIFINFFRVISGLLIILMGFFFFKKESLIKYTSHYYPLFRLKVFDSHSGENPRSTSLIHSKIFLIDNQTCFLGSANFTYSGFKTHYETVIKVEDEKAIKDINNEIEELYNYKELSNKDIQEWGRSLYE